MSSSTMRARLSCLFSMCVRGMVHNCCTQTPTAGCRPSKYSWSRKQTQNSGMTNCKLSNAALDGHAAESVDSRQFLPWSSHAKATTHGVPRGVGCLVHLSRLASRFHLRLATPWQDHFWTNIRIMLCVACCAFGCYAQFVLKFPKDCL